MRFTPFLVIISSIILAASAGCMESVKSDDLHKRDASSEYRWELAGSFGGNAEIARNSDDPWQLRYKNGGFKLVSGLCATSDEVWVTDLGISRIQVFDFDGRHLRNIGRGVPLDGTLPTDEENHFELNNIKPKEEQRWEETNGQPWADDITGLFKAADVVAVNGGYWLADWARTSALNGEMRGAAVRFYPTQGEPRSIDFQTVNWPSFIAYGKDTFAMADSTSNFAWLVNLATDKWETKELQRGAYFNRLMTLETEYAETPQYIERHTRIINGTNSPGGFYQAAGVALAFDKLVACDHLNKRLQVFEARFSTGVSWGGIAKVISRMNNDGETRFGSPWDVDVSQDGMVFVLDSTRVEIAVLNPEFERVGSFGKGELTEPYALDLSDDGKHCFISDRRFNKVFHYELQD